MRNKKERFYDSVVASGRGSLRRKFQKQLFYDDENGDELSVYVQSPDLTECAEKCVEAFNNLTESEINEICKEIIGCAKENGVNKDFELPAIDNALDILNFVGLRHYM